MILKFISLSFVAWIETTSDATLASAGPVADDSDIARREGRMSDVVVRRRALQVCNSAMNLRQCDAALADFEEGDHQAHG
jgi:hypothetical protein